MNFKDYLTYLLIFLFISCSGADNQQAKNDILNTEQAFSQMATELGVKEAFLAFAADSAVLNRNGRIIKGKSEIEAYFDGQTMQNIQLEWEPEFVEVAESGELGYTYGPFEFFGISAQGDTVQSTGIFHTVWEKQDDGTWKYVYD